MRGACNCGQVVFEVDPPFRPVILCHCTQCRAWSGHVWGASSVPLSQFRLIEQAGLKWYAASDQAERGFCGGCGASMFWRPFGEERISFAPGAVDGPTGLTVEAEWFAESAGDYYTTPSTTDSVTAACLCGANKFSIAKGIGAVTACHCSQCRKSSGHFAASFDTEEAALIWAARDTREHGRPGGAARGFCRCCGSSLYFRAAGGAFSVEAGCITAQTGGHLARHIFTSDKGDYYTLADGLPQEE